MFNLAQADNKWKSTSKKHQHSTNKQDRRLKGEHPKRIVFDSLFEWTKKNSFHIFFWWLFVSYIVKVSVCVVRTRLNRTWKNKELFWNWKKKHSNWANKDIRWIFWVFTLLWRATRVCAVFFRVYANSGYISISKWIHKHNNHRLKLTFLFCIRFFN